MNRDRAGTRPRDFVDVAARSNGFVLERLCELASEKDAGFSRSVLVEMLGSFGRFRPDEFGMSPSAHDELARAVEQWRQQLSVMRRPIELPGPGLGLSGSTASRLQVLTREPNCSEGDERDGTRRTAPATEPHVTEPEVTLWTRWSSLLSGRPQVRVLSRARESAGQTGYLAKPAGARCRMSIDELITDLIVVPGAGASHCGSSISS